MCLKCARWFDLTQTMVPMNTPRANAAKRLLVTIWLFLLGALAAYLAVTYLVAVELKPQPPQMRTFLGVLEVTAAVEFLIGMLVEGMMIRRADSPSAVIRAGIVSAAIGEAIGVYGFVWFFIAGERVVAFFIVSGLYFLRLFIKLPEFKARIDALA